jgi:hypothetical protein
MQCYPRGWPCASLTGSGQQLWCPPLFGRRAGRTPTTYHSSQLGRIKIIRAPGGCTNPLHRGATVSIRALVFPYTAGHSAISARFTLNQHRRCRWFKSPLGHRTHRLYAHMFLDRAGAELLRVERCVTRSWSSRRRPRYGPRWRANTLSRRTPPVGPGSDGGCSGT